MEIEASQPLQAQEEYHRLTLQTLHRWTDGWRPSEMIAFDSRNIGPDDLAENCILDNGKIKKHHLQQWL